MIPEYHDKRWLLEYLLQALCPVQENKQEMNAPKECQL
jgi:hypothetical protein